MNQRINCAARLALLTGLVCGCLAACGGADNAAESEHTDGGAGSISPLLADDGTRMPSAPDTIPVDAAARTRSGHYASSRQAEQLEHALGDGVIRVNVECCGVAGVDQAVAIAYGAQAAGDLPNNAPVLVRSADLRLGAMAANLLSDAGYDNVWLVTR